ncbi:hypothetical protein DFH06DRAFT_58570 [Mycena polygramma]|nr:hypothetical protein DFH06DRAFT_58570 [Mycena polygramma]
MRASRVPSRGPVIFLVLSRSTLSAIERSLGLCHVTCSTLLVSATSWTSPWGRSSSRTSPRPCCRSPAAPQTV